MKKMSGEKQIRCIELVDPKVNIGAILKDDEVREASGKFRSCLISIFSTIS